MRKFLATTVLLAIAAGCTAAPRPLNLPKADREYLVGTWLGQDEDVVFLLNGTYCTYAAGTLAASSIGTWAASESGHVTVAVAYAEDSYRITPDDDAVELRAVRIPEDGKLLMGYYCSHCPGTLVGSTYERSSTQRKSCVL